MVDARCAFSLLTAMFCYGQLLDRFSVHSTVLSAQREQAAHVHSASAEPCTPYTRTKVHSPWSTVEHRPINGRLAHSVPPLQACASCSCLDSGSEHPFLHFRCWPTGTAVCSGGSTAQALLLGRVRRKLSIDTSRQFVSFLYRCTM